MRYGEGEKRGKGRKGPLQIWHGPTEGLIRACTFLSIFLHSSSKKIHVHFLIISFPSQLSDYLEDGFCERLAESCIRDVPVGVEISGMESRVVGDECVDLGKRWQNSFQDVSDT